MKEPDSKGVRDNDRLNFAAICIVISKFNIMVKISQISGTIEYFCTVYFLNYESIIHYYCQYVKTKEILKQRSHLWMKIIHGNVVSTKVNLRQLKRYCIIQEINHSKNLLQAYSSKELCRQEKLDTEFDFLPSVFLLKSIFMKLFCKKLINLT